MFKALLVGAGAMGRAWGENLSNSHDVEFVSWVDILPDTAATAAEKLEVHLKYVGTDFHQAVSESKPDFVVDVTIPEAHRDVTLAALKLGLPVIGEKPMSSTMDSAREMVRVSEETGKLYMVSQSRRYDAGVQAYRRLIHENIGSPEILNSDFYIGAHFGGFRDMMPSPLLLDMAIHTVDAARFLSGQDPVSVYCEEFNPTWSWYEGASSATAIFEMTGGLRYTFRGSWCSEGKHTSWEADWRAIGPRGTAIWDGLSDPEADVVIESAGFYSKLVAKTEPRDNTIDQAIAGSLKDMVRFLRDGTVPMGECHDNIKSLAMIFGAIESARIGQRVLIEV